MFALHDYESSKSSGVQWPDFYFGPEYGEATAALEASNWYVAVWNNGDIVFPFILREIKGFDGALNGIFYDAVSPYGYAGTYIKGSVSFEDFAAFRDRLSQEYRRLNVVSEFHRQSSLVGEIDVLKGFFGESFVLNSNTVYIKTDYPYEDIWSNYEGRARTKTRKALKLGYSWRVRAATLDDVSEGSDFRKLYHQTMSRLGAKAFYFFSNEYFCNLVSRHKGSVYTYEVVNQEGRVVVSAIYFVSGDWVHLHLVGNDAEAMRDGVGNLSYDGLIRWAAEQEGIKRVHIGGGVTEGDSLFKFKRSFGGLPTPFYVYKGIVDPVQYNALCQAKALSVSKPLSEIMSSDFFPAYRADFNEDN